jgi:hypothetical protein
VSNRVCCHNGRKLPENHTCGARCADFPGCISIPVEVVFDLATVDEKRGVAERETARRIEILGTMHNAIEIGLAAKGEERGSRLVESPGAYIEAKNTEDVPSSVELR